jgi:hypothetical protein
LLLEFFDARFPKITTAQQITNRDTQLPNLLLFLSGATLPEITAGSQFPDLASSILVVDHCCTSAPKPALPGPESSMKSNVRKEHRLDSLVKESWNEPLQPLGNSVHGLPRQEDVPEQDKHDSGWRQSRCSARAKWRRRQMAINDLPQLQTLQKRIDDGHRTDF